MMPEFETKDKVSSAYGSPEQRLCEEIAFWREYIEQCKRSGNGSVPSRSLDALELAEQKLLRLQTTQDNGDGTKCRMH